MTRAPRFERCDQCGITANFGTAHSGANTELTFTEKLIFDIGELRAFDTEMAATHKPHRLTASRSVERLGHRRPPVDNDRLTFVIRNSEASNVKGLMHSVTVETSDAINAAKDEGRVVKVELTEAGHDLTFEHVGFPASLMCAATAGLSEVAQLPGVVSTACQTLVRPIDVGLFFSQIRMMLSHAPFRGSRFPRNRGWLTLSANRFPFEPGRRELERI